MAKKAKGETLDLFYLNTDNTTTKQKKENNKKRSSKDKKKNRESKTKDNLFDFDNEIVIGINSMPKENKNKPSKKQNKKKTTNTKKVREKNTSSNKDVDLKPLRKGQAKSVSKKKKKTPPKPNIKNQELAEKKKRVIFKLLKWTTFIGLIIGASVYIVLSPVFNIKEITTSGNSKISSEELVSLSGISIEENTFKIDKTSIIEEIKQNPYIESVLIKRRLPDKIEIIIEERKPTYMIQFANAYMYINNQGYMLEISNKNIGLPIIIGFVTNQESMHPGNRLCAEDLQRLGDVLKIIESAHSNDIGDLTTKIDISDKQDYILTLKKEKKTVHIGDTTNLSTKMLYIKAMIENEKGKSGEIFVNMDLNTREAFFREKI